MSEGNGIVVTWLSQAMSRESGIALLVCASIAALMFHFLLKKNTDETTKNEDKKSKKLMMTKKRAPICPFSQETNFEVETAEHLPPAPLDLFEDWLDKINDLGQPELPLGARWLEAGISGQDTPGILRAGLKRLRNSKHFLIEEDFRIREELLLKEKALNDPKRFPLVYVEEPGSLAAQQECLELFLSYLPKRYPHLYAYDEKANTLRVEPLEGRVFQIDEWMQTRPLELCERIVQEDLILMRPPKASEEEKGFCMAAAAVVFSFSELQEKLGAPVDIIHAPVPGYQKHLRKTLNLTFGKLLKAEAPLWRNNWAIAPTGSLDEPVYGSEANQEKRTFSKPTVESLKAMFLKVEYQTIRRLPKTGNLLFTVRTMADSMSSLEKVPKAAGCLAYSIRGMSSGMHAYKGINDEDTKDAVLAYLDTISPPEESNEEKK